ncbi:MAG: hypothetical protein JRJ26_02520 [Deltaproteobacteria bacterium]|nr:hypothetical protein [Deltaproteobacteria bacterium]
MFHRGSAAIAELMGWSVFLVAGIGLAVFGILALSTRNHNAFVFALFLIAVGIVLFFAKFGGHGFPSHDELRGCNRKEAVHVRQHETRNHT